MPYKETNDMKRKSLTIETKIEEQVNMNRTFMPGMPNFGFDDNDINNEHQTEIAETEVITATISNAGEINEERIKEGGEPILSSKYIKEDSFYVDKYQGESLSALKTEFDNQKKYRRFTFFGLRNANSDEMNAVMEAVGTLVNIFDDKSMSLKKGMSREDFEAEYKRISDQYRTIVTKCEAYLNDEKKNKKNNRYAMIKRMHEAAFREMEYLESAAENTFIQVNSGESATEVGWKDVIRECRSLHYESGKDGVKITRIGANSSNLAVIEANGEKLFFKEDETYRDYTMDDVRRVVSSCIENPDNGLTEEQREIVRQRVGALQSVISSLGLSDIDEARIYGGIYKIAELNVYSTEDFERTIHQVIWNECKIPNGTNVLPLIDAFKELVYSGVPKEKLKRIEEGTEELSEEEREKLNAEKEKRKLNDDEKAKVKESAGFITTAFREIGRNFFALYFMKNQAKLPKGAKITTNNVATSRFASMLGVDFIAKSRSTVVSINGVSKKGIVMEEAKGTITHDVPKFLKKDGEGEDPNRRTKYSGAVKRDLMNLSIMDFIMGQVDRHSGNYNVETKEEGERLVISKLHVFDNDACCGLMTGKEMNESTNKGQRHSRLITGNKINIPALDMEFVNKVMAIRDEDLAFEFMDLLNKSQIAAMIDRLNYVKRIISSELNRAKENKNSIKFIENEKQWDEYGKTPEEQAKLTSYNSLLFRADMVSLA